MNNYAAASIPAMHGDPLPVRPWRFAAICLALFILVMMLPEAVLAPLNRATAHLAGLCIALFGGQARVSSDMISLDGFLVKIITECTALYCIMLHGAFIMSVPASIKARIAGFLAGGAFLTTADILRIALVTIIGAVHPALFEAAHIYLAQIVMLLMVIVVSLAWLRWAANDDEWDGPFLIRIGLLASAIFPFWLMANVPYVRLADRLVSGLFNLANYRVIFSYEYAAFFQTFNVVLYCALMLAERRLFLRCRLACAIAGCVILAAGHLLFRIGNVLLTGFSWQPALPLTIFLNLFGEYLLPVLLWIAAINVFSGKKENLT
ncbi:MAG TPA: exosortase H [Geobacteraceae bacterium]|nr:exosortase H [Geobacteraceae bacterium]